jgi:cobalt-zinc-cadmium efflux system membrane fusion protein
MGEVVARDKVLFTVVDLSVAWIEAAVFERDLAKVRVGAPAVVMVAAYPEESFRGEIAYIDSVLDKETRTVKVRIEVPNRDGRLKLGMFASAAIETPGRRSGLSVPDEAVVLVQGRPTVFVEEGEGFEARTVETGERIGGRTLIASGLAPGEKVAVAGAYALKARMLKSQLGEGHAH